MKASLEEVSRTKSVSVEEARALGFQDEALDYDPQNSRQVIIPAWRHALISLKNPLLEQGLRILDTPGLNALGSEPELRSEEHTSELQSRPHLVCRLLLEKKKYHNI